MLKKYKYFLSSTLVLQPRIFTRSYGPRARPISELHLDEIVCTTFSFLSWRS